MEVGSKVERQRVESIGNNREPGILNLENRMIY